MANLIHLPSAVKHFRWLAQDWLSHAKNIRKVVKNMEKNKPAGEIDYEFNRQIRQLVIDAEYHEKLGKELKELASDVLHDRVSAI